MTLPADSRWHGTHHGYGNLCCRCAVCRRFRADYMRGLRARKRAEAAARVAAWRVRE